MRLVDDQRLFPAMGLIPIEREQARKAMAALEVAAGVLHRGDVLRIYPEGTRSRDGLLHKRPHRGRPAGADVRRADRAGRPRRHRPDPADRRPRAAAVPRGRSSASASRSTRRRTAGPAGAGAR